MTCTEGLHFWDWVRAYSDTKDVLCPAQSRGREWDGEGGGERQRDNAQSRGREGDGEGRKKRQRDNWHSVVVGAVCTSQKFVLDHYYHQIQRCAPCWASGYIGLTTVGQLWLNHNDIHRPHDIRMCVFFCLAVCTGLWISLVEKPQLLSASWDYVWCYVHTKSVARFKWGWIELGGCTFSVSTLLTVGFDYRVTEIRTSDSKHILYPLHKCTVSHLKLFGCSLGVHYSDSLLYMQYNIIYSATASF